TWRFTSWTSPYFFIFSSSSGQVTPRDRIRWSSGYARTRMFTRSVSIEAMSSREVISISVAIFRIFSRSVCPDLTYSSMIGVVEALLAELQAMDFLRELADDVPRGPSANLLQAVHDLLFAAGERRRLGRDRQGRLRFGFGGLRGRPAPFRGRLRLLLLRGGLCLYRRGPQLLEDLLGLFLREQLRESIDLRSRELLEGEAGVGQDRGGLLRKPAVAERLDRGGAGHAHSSDGGSSSSTSTSSSEISTYMSFSVSPYEAIS